MANEITYASKLTEQLDKMFVQSAVTGFLTDNALRAKFVGAHTVLIPEMDMVGLGDYDRSVGFADGSVSVTNSSFTLSQDRGRSFMLDTQDEDESGIANLAGQVLGEFVRTKVVPEVDAYCLSKLAGVALENSHAPAFDIETPLKSLLGLISSVREAVGYDEQLVAFLNPTMFDALMATPEISRHVRIDDFKKGEIKTQVKHIDGVALLPVPSARMKTAYDFFDGSTDGQTDGGFTPAENAGDIYALVMPKKGASLIRKTEKVRTFSPDQNQKADAYKFDYRLYYDILVKNSQKDGIYVGLK